MSLTVIKVGMKRCLSDKLWDEDQEPRAKSWLPGMKTGLSLHRDLYLASQGQRRL